ncbi:hypothetical protein [Lysinibacillus parviboronicapiens]|uniref:hypothetical protein n=1 Tax=Lysinibacillus parviboronicapiens TaxID=436516 RepID=UPI0006D0F940|nr:hypothetical protein [Lysinibacillus parviboronicapiens]
MKRNDSWSAVAKELLKCPHPNCHHVGQVITKAHCRIHHNMEREEMKKKYGMPFRLITRSEEQVKALVKR